MKINEKTPLLIPVFLLQAALFLNGCAGSDRAFEDTGHYRASAHSPVSIHSANVMPTIFQVAQGLAMQLRQNLRGQDLENWPCMVTSFADIDNLDSSSRFGRLLAEAVSSELFKQGAVIRDLRSAKTVFVQPRNGELILSRDAGNLPREMSARAVIAGTYGKGASSVAVNVRMIDLRTKAVISVAMTELARTAAIEALLMEPQKEKAAMAAPPTSYDTQTF